MIRIFIGFDYREEVAYHVLARSIQVRASRPCLIAPIALEQLDGIYDRAINPLQSTAFSFSRFLIPYLCNYQGWAIFMDCDMLVQDDIAKLWDQRDKNYAVQVVKHDYVPKSEQKFLGATQTKYPRKNWSSMMLFNNEKCQALTMDYANNASGLELHQFKWLDNDDLIGGLDKRWNYLAGEYPHKDDVSIVHYTLGGPYFDAYKDCDFAKEWFLDRDAMLRTHEVKMGDAKI
ncbi:MAG: glycosyltransferase [Pseudomonadota bacterium]